MKKKILISSVCVIALCLCLIAGSTFALFTTNTSVNIAVTAGDLDVQATVDATDMKMRSLGDDDGEFNRNAFANGGTASFDDENSVLTISNMTPGDAVRFDIIVSNGDDMIAKYKFNWESNGVEEGETDMINALTVSVFDENGDPVGVMDTYQTLGLNDEVRFTVVVEFVNHSDTDDDNQYKGAKANINFTVEAVQPNAVDRSGNLITD